MARRDLAAACLLLVFSAGYGLLTLGLPDRGLPNTPGPAFFPGLIAVALVILSVALLARGLRTIPDDAATLPEPVTPRGWMALGMFVVYLLVMPTLGFLTASVPFFAGLTWAYGERRVVVIALTSLAVPAVLFLVFRMGFRIFLPSGIGW
jgi:putative tricarboxylic transport membrane protein